MDKFIPYPMKFKFMDETIGRRSQIYEMIKKSDNYKSMSKKEQKVWNKEHPIPKDGFNSGGYEWCVKYRGTKWNFCYPDLETETETELAYRFSTAWSPPIPVIITMSKKFPSLTFILNYETEGTTSDNDELTFKNGNRV